MKAIQAEPFLELQSQLIWIPAPPKKYTPMTRVRYEQPHRHGVYADPNWYKVSEWVFCGDRIELKYRVQRMENGEWRMEDGGWSTEDGVC